MQKNLLWALINKSDNSSGYRNQTKRDRLILSICLSERQRFFIGPMLGIIILSVGALCEKTVFAKDWFNPDLLSISGVNTPQSRNCGIDLSRFEKGEQIPGLYRVSLWINGDRVDDRDVNFIAGPKGELVPAMTRKEYEVLGVRPDATAAFSSLAEDEVVKYLSHVLPASTTAFLFSEQRLNITVPQIMMRQQPPRSVDPSQWNQGMPAILLDYVLTGNQTRDQSGSGTVTTDGLYGNLRGGLNLGPWRLRNYTAYRRTQSGSNSAQSDFQVISTYLKRNVAAVQGELTAGDSSTPSDVFDSVQFRGIQLASDDAMLPDSLHGFAPVVRGVANTNAQVTILQNGNIIYQTYVPPGPFEIADIYPSNLSGDLMVVVKENNGQVHHFIQTYSSVAVMRREGQMKYAVTVGGLRNGNLQKVNFTQGTMIYGLPHGFTLYGGLQMARSYFASSLGGGIGFGQLGALSMDVTQADTTLLSGKKTQGQSYRMRYSKSMLKTGTLIFLTVARYSSMGFYNLQNAVAAGGAVTKSCNSNLRSEMGLTMNQNIREWGSLNASITQHEYWKREQRKQQTWMLGYNFNLKETSYGLSYSWTPGLGNVGDDRRFFFNVSVPLSMRLSGNESYNINANYSYSDGPENPPQHMASISGTLLNDNRLIYNLNGAFQEQQSSMGVSVTYMGRNGVIQTGYNRSLNQAQINYGLSGGVLFHPYGITLSQPMGETLALIRASGASGLKVQSQPGLTTNIFGYAVMPSLTPYRRTDISLDPSGLDNTVSLSQTSSFVVPTRGAVVLADFQTKQGKQILMTVLHPDRTAIPFGAIATVVQREENSSIVGDSGQVFLTGLPDKGELSVQWGNKKEQHCKVAFHLPQVMNSDMPLQVKEICR
ncbi:fimbrial biogenesis outer membrane usher protein [Salmonella enterica]|nr:fimbrial biogenesis outer membrane usher protein [Salmonella enterica]EDQ6154729.1 fimbrial biogenesis outer membrane usher protein [Salmonella enterica subsp. enterica serovar Javiana]EBR7649416.1 fimbrial biogenesis outer membrane usher protein [Salmonella enterica]EEC5487493.1 fimbrial biogenesis outer membrane usher protein [Salmonella enterica]EEF7968621.1 fimbrial biogenesis outer membrane usher protein [Salmonella enterica]